VDVRDPLAIIRSLRIVSVRFLVTFAICVAILVGASVDHAEKIDVIQLENEIQHIVATTQLWPGFDPLAVPPAVRTDGDIVVLDHPSTKARFQKASVDTMGLRITIRLSSPNE